MPIAIFANLAILALLTCFGWTVVVMDQQLRTAHMMVVLVVLTVGLWSVFVLDIPKVAIVFVGLTWIAATRYADPLGLASLRPHEAAFNAQLWTIAHHLGIEGRDSEIRRPQDYAKIRADLEQLVPPDDRWGRVPFLLRQTAGAPHDGQSLRAGTSWHYRWLVEAWDDALNQHVLWHRQTPSTAFGLELWLLLMRAEDAIDARDLSQLGVLADMFEGLVPPSSGWSITRDMTLSALRAAADALAGGDDPRADDRSVAALSDAMQSWASAVEGST